jgi:putative endonuclease
MTTARQRLATGGYGEASAARYLTGLGMVVLDRNWRCELGEVDLVLRDGAVLVFCEVKTRTTAAYGTPLEAVTPVKVARLRKLAARWMQDHGLRVPEVRIDLVGVLLTGGAEHRIDHVRGVGG